MPSAVQGASEVYALPSTAPEAALHVVMSRVTTLCLLQPSVFSHAEAHSSAVNLPSSLVHDLPSAPLFPFLQAPIPKSSAAGTNHLSTQVHANWPQPQRYVKCRRFARCIGTVSSPCAAPDACAWVPTSCMHHPCRAGRWSAVASVSLLPAQTRAMLVHNLPQHQPAFKPAHCPAAWLLPWTQRDQSRQCRRPRLCWPP